MNRRRTVCPGGSHDLSRRPLNCLLPFASIIFVLATACPAVRLKVEDFEAGVSRWTLNDINKDQGHGDVLLCDIMQSTPGRKGGTDKAALVSFRKATDSWASASLPVDGERWREAGVKRLRFWFKGNGSPHSVDLMLRAKDAARHETKFSVKLSLADSKWQEISVPLDSLKEGSVTALSLMGDLYLLQFVERDTWPSLFFCVDDIEADSNEPAKPGPEPRKPRPEPAPREPKPVPAEIAVDVNFERQVGISRLALGSNLVRDPDRLSDNAKFRDAVTWLGLKFVRVRTADLVTPPRREGESFDYSRLEKAVAAIVAAGCQPLVCISHVGEVDARKFVPFCQNLVKHFNTGKRPRINTWEVFDEPTSGASAITVDQALQVVTKVRAAMLAADPKIKVGGLGEASAWQPHLQACLRSSTQLDFLSFHFYAARSSEVSDAKLLDAAERTMAEDLPYQLSFRALREAANRMRSKDLPLYVTEANLNAEATDDGVATDARATSLLSAAWFSALLARSAPVVDVLFQYELSDASWGLLNAAGEAYPAYYSLWLYRTYFPEGTTLYQAQCADPNVVVLAGRSRTSNNVLIVHTSAEEALCRVSASGTGEISKIKVRRLDRTQPKIQFPEFPADTSLRVPLPGYTIAVVQFVPQPASTAAPAVPATSAGGPGA